MEFRIKIGIESDLIDFSKDSNYNSKIFPHLIEISLIKLSSKEHQGSFQTLSSSSLSGLGKKSNLNDFPPETSHHRKLLLNF